MLFKCIQWGVCGLWVLSVSGVWAVEGHVVSPSAAEVERKRRVCVAEFVGMDVGVEVARVRLQEAVEAIKRAGEHPSRADFKVILDALTVASNAGVQEAQRRLGFYVIGFWMTDLLFWPKEPKVALHAFAMLRDFALHSQKRGVFLDGLRLTPPAFDPNEGIGLPRRWMVEGEAYLKRWRACFVLWSRKRV